MADNGSLTAKEVSEAIKKHTLSGTLLSESGADSEALEHYKKAYAYAKQLNSAATHRLCALNLGAAYLTLNKYKLAEKYLSKALEQSGGETARQSANGTLRVTSKCTIPNSSSAARSFTVTRESNGDLFYNIALLNERRQSLSEAESWYESALAEYSRFEPTSYYAIGLATEKLARLAERNNPARDGLALARYEAAKGKFEDALNQFVDGSSQCEQQSLFQFKSTDLSSGVRYDVQQCVIHAITCYYAALHIVRKLNDAMGKQRLADAFINLLEKVAANRVRLDLLTAGTFAEKAEFISSLHLGVIYYDIGLFCVENRQLEKAIHCFEAALEHIRSEPAPKNDPDAPVDDGSGAPFATIGATTPRNQSSSKRRSRRKSNAAKRETRTGRLTVRERYEPAIQQNLGALYNAVGDYQRSIAFHERAAALFIRLTQNLPSEAPADWNNVQFEDLAKRLQRSVAQCFANLAFACYSLGQMDNAFAVYETALSSARAAQDVRTEWQSLEALAILCVTANRLDEAVSFLQDAVIAVGNDPLAVASRNRFAANDVDSLVYTDYYKLGPKAVPDEDVYYVQNTDDPAKTVSSEQRKLVAKLSALLERVVARNSDTQKARPTIESTDSLTIPNRLLLTVNAHLSTFTQRANHYATVTSSLPLSATYSTLPQTKENEEIVFPFSRWSLDSYRPRLSHVAARNTLPSLDLTAGAWSLSDDDSDVCDGDVEEGDYVVPNRLGTVSAARRQTENDSVKLSNPDDEDAQPIVDDAADEEDVYETLKPTYRQILVERVSSPVDTNDYGCVTHPPPSSASTHNHVTFSIDAPPVDMQSHPSRAAVPPTSLTKEQQQQLIVEQTSDDDCDYPGCEVQSAKPINNVAQSATDSPRPTTANAAIYSQVIRNRNDAALNGTEQEDEDETQIDRDSKILEDEEDPLEEIDNTYTEALLKSNQKLPPTQPTETTSDVADSQQKSCSSSTCLIL